MGSGLKTMSSQLTFENCGDESLDLYRAFDAAHPEVWGEFRRISLQLARRGFRAYSAYGVMHVVRFETSAGASGPERLNGGFKINNNVIPLYARRFLNAYPQYEGFFRTRERKSAKVWIK